jgi:hypothetical protein
MDSNPLVLYSKRKKHLQSFPVRNLFKRTTKSFIIHLLTSFFFQLRIHNLELQVLGSSHWKTLETLQFSWSVKREDCKYKVGYPSAFHFSPLLHICHRSPSFFFSCSSCSSSSLLSGGAFLLTPRTKKSFDFIGRWVIEVIGDPAALKITEFATKGGTKGNTLGMKM